MRPSPARRPLRIVFYQPHKNIWFKDPVRHILRGESLPHKYAQLFDSLLASGAETYASSSLCRQLGWKGWVRYLLDPIELALWVHLNKVGFNKMRLIFTKAGLRSADAIFFMHYGNFTHELAAQAERGDHLARCLADVNVPKIAHLTHYAYHPAIGARNLQTVGATLLFAENNLQKNSRFYQKHFGKLAADFWCLPFVAAKRFTCATPFSQRTNKLVATGSITYKMLDPEFISFFKTDDLQPVRRQLYKRAGEFSAEIDSLISDLNASRVADSAKPEPTWLRVVRRLFPFKHPRQEYHRYYKKNIVEVYNSYTMFAVPEELGDLPAIGFVEGMACGCAYFGLDDPMYRDLGMEPGVHYVAYDGTVQGLADKVRFYQKPEHMPQLEQIAARGCELVNEKFRAEVVYRAFFDRLQRVLKPGAPDA